jgi:hypothetical protein
MHDDKLECVDDHVLTVAASSVGCAAIHALLDVNGDAEVCGKQLT